MKIKHLFLYLFLCCLLPLSFSCEDKDEADNLRNAIIGTWQLTSVQINGVSAEPSAYPDDIIQFQPNYIFQSYNTTTEETTRGEWSYEDEMLNISIYLPVAFYVLEANAQNLSLKRLDFNSEGTLTTTIQEYRKINDEL
jgi:hypothetical protein